MLTIDSWAYTGSSWMFQIQGTRQAKEEGATYELRRLENVVAVVSRRTLENSCFEVKRVELEADLGSLACL